MAGYREFYKPINYAVADSDYLAEGTASLFNALNQRRAEKQKAAGDFNYELKGKSESDQKLLTEYAKNVFDKGYNEIRSGRGTSADTKRMMMEGKSLAERSQLQFEEADRLNKEIVAKETKDAYYNSEPALRGLKMAYDGENGEKNLFNRDLKSFAKTIDQVSSDPRESTFRQNKYRQDYIKSFKDKSVESSSENPNYAKSKYNQAVFWDEEKNTPAVTNQHAIDYLKSDGRVDQYFSAVVNDQLKKEIEQMKASGDPRVAWMKSGNAANLTGGKAATWKSDEEIMHEITDDPTKNIINGKTYGERKRELARQDLAKGDRTNSKVSVEYKEPKESKNPDGTNDSVAHSTTFISGNTGTSGNLDVTDNRVSGPGGNLMTKKGTNPGKPIVTDLTSVRAFNFGENKNVGRNNGKFNITGYQLSAYDNNGNLVPIGGNGSLDVIAKINAMKPEDFANLSPNMQPSVKGFAIDESKMMGDINNKIEKLNEDIADAEEDGDDDKVDRLKRRIEDLNGLRGYYNQPNVDNQDLINSALSMGVKQIRVDQLLSPNQADLSRINDLTGLDLRNEAKWSPEMQEVAKAYRKKYQEAQAAGFTSSQAAPKNSMSNINIGKTNQNTTNGTVRVINPNGQPGTIPADKLEAAIAAGYKQVD